MLLRLYPLHDAPNALPVARWHLETAGGSDLREHGGIVGGLGGPAGSAVEVGANGSLGEHVRHVLRKEVDPADDAL